MLDVKNISYRAGDKQIIIDASTVFVPGLLHVIVGPNGSGKSTLLKIMSGELKPNSGVVHYDGENIFIIDKTNLAKRRAFMSQLPELYFPLRVEEVVSMGRYPHFTYQPSQKDTGICEQVMKELEVDTLADRDYLTLSGGEKQRVQFARALAQIWEAPVAGHRCLLLDEPVSSLDIHYQHQFLQIVQSLKKERMILIVVLHDINLAMQYADRVLFMKGGKIVRDGKVAEVITAELVKEVFDIPVEILDNPFGNAAMVVYSGKNMESQK